MHTDQGTQYKGRGHRQLLRQVGALQSMSRRGNCWDNAVAESFFKTLKVELIYRETFHSFDQAHRAIFEYIEGYYNRRRPHSHLNFLAPDEYERVS